MRVRRFLHLILLAGVLGLIGQVWQTWSHNPTPDIIQPPQAPGTALPVIPVARLGTGQQLAKVITEKNLFSPDRKTAQEAPPKEEEKPDIPPPRHLKLVGVFLFDSKKEAFFQDSSKGGKVVRVATGGSLGAYHLTHLTHSEATLTIGENGQQVDMRIDIQKSKDAAKAPRILPTRPKPAPQTPQGRQEGTEQAEEVAQPVPSYNQILGGDAASAPVLGAASPQTAATGTEQASSDNSQDEALSIRQNIRQLQRRLREIRRVRAQERRAEREQGRDQ